MTGRIKNLLIVAMEECSEIIKACSKAIRFGLDTKFDDFDDNHKTEILIEYYQLQAIIERLQKDGAIPYFNEKRIKSIKKHKIEKVQKYYEQNKNRV